MKRQLKMQNRPMLLLFTVLNSQIQLIIIANRMGFNFKKIGLVRLKAKAIWNFPENEINL